MYFLNQNMSLHFGKQILKLCWNIYFILYVVLKSNEVVVKAVLNICFWFATLAFFELVQNFNLTVFEQTKLIWV